MVIYLKQYILNALLHFLYSKYATACQQMSLFETQIHFPTTRYGNAFPDYGNAFRDMYWTIELLISG